MLNILMTYYVHCYIQKCLWVHMLAGFCYGACGLWPDRGHTGMGVGHIPHKFISSTLEMPLYFVVK